MRNLFTTIKELDRNLTIFTRVVKELRDAAEPFTSGDIVDETEGTEPLMDRLESAIKKVDDFMPKDTFSLDFGDKKIS